MQEKADSGVRVRNGQQRCGTPARTSPQRKVRRVVLCSAPEPPERKEIFQIHLDKRKRSKVLSEEEVIQLVEETEGFSGAEIEAAIVEGMYTAFSSGRDLKAADIKIALSETVSPLQDDGGANRRNAEMVQKDTRPANTIVSHKTKTHGRAVEA